MSTIKKVAIVLTMVSSGVAVAAPAVAAPASAAGAQVTTQSTNPNGMPGCVGCW